MKGFFFFFIKSFTQVQRPTRESQISIPTWNNSGRNKYVISNDNHTLEPQLFILVHLKSHIVKNRQIVIYCQTLGAGSP